ncbi:hypothetical protein [Zhongshania marina]|nr:hypothetical protein [Marortus luteolus]
MNKLADKYSKQDFDGELEKCVDLQSADAVEGCYKRERNKIIKDLMAIVDWRYQTYEGNISANQSHRDFGFGMGGSLLSLGSSVSTVETTKTIFSTLSSAIQTTATKYDESYLADQASAALILQMRTDRSLIRPRLLAGLQMDFSDYNLAQAVGDILQYYRAGTLADAAQSLRQSTSSNAQNAEDKTTETVETLLRDNKKTKGLVGETEAQSKLENADTMVGTDAEGT